MKKIINILALFLILLFLSNAVLASIIKDSQRDVLALYHSNLNGGRFLNPIYNHFEPALSHLGLIVHYYNFENGMPDFKKNPEFKHINKIIIALDEDEINDPRAFWSFIEILLRADKKIVFMNWPGPLIQRGQRNKDYTIEANKALALMGLRFGEEYSTVLFDIDVEKADNKGFDTFSKNKSFFEAPYMGYETPVKAPGLTFTQIHSFGKQNKVILKLKKRSTNSISDSIVITPNGGFAASGAVFTENPVDDNKKLKLNIYRFFEDALDIVGQPRPDVSVITGKRVYFSHIDGDGFNSLTIYDPKKTCGQAMYEFFQKYGDMPVSCSVITSEMNSKSYSLKNSVETAKQIFKLSNIEPASHTHTHPLIWDKAVHPEGVAGEYAGDMDHNNQQDYYTSYKVLDYKFSRKYEVQGAIEYINNELVPKENPFNCSTVFWSGNCIPGRRSIEYSFEKGFYNINGGDPRFDSFYDSRIYLCPVLRVVEGTDYFQIWAAACNENLYTNLWQGPYYGFSNVIQTFENTGKPDILKPVNVYYHHYSAERVSSVQALDKIMIWARQKDFFKAFASDYCRSVFGYRKVLFTKTKQNCWAYENAEDLETIRFDISDPQVIIDMDESTGITGYRRINSSLYSFLDSSSRGAGKISLKKIKKGDKSGFKRPFLHESSSFISNLVFRANSFEFDFERQRAGSSRECVWIIPDDWISVKIIPSNSMDYELRGNKLVIKGSNKNKIRVRVKNNTI